MYNNSVKCPHCENINTHIDWKYEVYRSNRNAKSGSIIVPCVCESNENHKFNIVVGDHKGCVILMMEKVIKTETYETSDIEIKNN